MARAKKRKTKRAPTADAPAGKRAPRKPKKTSSHDESVASSGRALSALMKKHGAKIKKYNPKLFPASDVTKYAALVRQVTTAITEHQSGGSVAGATLAGKRAALEALIAAVSTLREEVRLAKPDDADLHSAVGVGMRLSTTVAKYAISVAALQQKSFESAMFGPRMRAAGITTARIKSLEALRRAAAGAATARGAAKGAKTGEGATKNAVVRALAKGNTRAIDVGVLVFKNEPKIRAQFEQYRQKRRAKKASKAPAPKPPATPPTPPTA